MKKTLLIVIFFFFYFSHESISLQKDQRIYDENNIFWKLLTGAEEFSTPKHVDSSFAISFEDIRKRTKEHVLIIPKGKYISFSHFSDNASPQEMEDLMRNVAHTAEKLALDKTGYRFISNHSLKPGLHESNDANQEIPHFHIHLAGNECLGKPVAGIKKNTNFPAPLSWFDEHGQLHLPQSFYWTPQHFIENALQHKISEKIITSNERSYRIIAYRSSEESLISVPQYIGFMILDSKKNSVYTSIHTFASKAEGPLISQFFSFIVDIAKSSGIHQTGYRLISNHGNDAWQSPKNVFVLFLAGGTPLSVTVTNVMGNAQWNAEKGEWLDTSAKLKDLLYPHEHCLQNLIDTQYLFQKIKNSSMRLSPQNNQSALLYKKKKIIKTSK